MVFQLTQLDEVEQPSTQRTTDTGKLGTGKLLSVR